ncbi:MAG: outer membrane protein transport protein [Lentisphaerae bacterium]|nr:outer membrane protein transport protein [Lentisphaerota bacterium]
MRKALVIALVGFMIVGAGSALATNGDNLMGVGAVSRGMGGVGIAMPQDSVSAVFNNPAALAACPCGVQSESVFGATIFAPNPSAKITLPTPTGPVTLEGSSGGQAFVIPAVGVTMSLSDSWRMGVGAYGVSGMGTDYRDQKWDLDGDPSNGYEGDLYTKLEVMKFVGMASCQVSDSLALGAALNGSYNSLDLEQGSAHDYGLGGQFGALLNLGAVSIGAAYTTPEKSTHRNVYNFDAFMGDSDQDDLVLESPASYGVGVAVTPAQTLVIEVDAKYLDWANAKGYQDFDWESQWVFAIGAQVQATEKVTVRCGYNYGKNPVVEHNGWDPMGVTSVQGNPVPTFGYEMLRTVGFPAIVESHATVGLSVRAADNMSLHLGYMHAFENTITETSAGGPFAITLESSLEEDSYSFSLAWAF